MSITRIIAFALISFFTGSVSLISQLLAIRLAQQELSVAPLTIAAVLASALLGLAIGSFVQGRFVDRVADARRRAAWLLILAAALLAAMALLGRPCLQWLIKFQMPSWGESIAFAATTVVPINFLLGGVIPLLSGVASRSGWKNGFAWIYASETLGAAIGALAWAFYFVPQFGLLKSALLLAGATTVVAAADLVASLVKREPAAVESGSQNKDNSPEVQTDHATGNSYGRGALLLAAIVASVATPGMELIWQRYFAVVYGSDSHSYALVVAIFLLGVSIGSLIASALGLRRAGRKLYGILLFCVGASIVGSVWLLYQGLQLEQFVNVLGWLDQHPMLARLSLTAAVLFLPAILAGVALPVLVRTWVANDPQPGRRTGEIFACVILGNVCGLFVVAIGVIPWLGLKGSALVLAVSCMLAGTILGGTSSSMVDRRRTWVDWFATTGLVGVFGVALLLVWQLQLIQQRVGQQSEDVAITEHYRETSNQIVAVVHAPNDSSRKQLLIDGVTIGESGGGAGEKQQVLAHLPFLIRNTEAARVLTIGLGSGLLAAELVDIPQVESVVCAELSEAVVEACTYFSTQNRNVLDHEKLSLIQGDGVRVLRLAKDKFDLIVSDGKSRPGAASNQTFFSSDYYRLCAKSLTPEGVFVQWVSLRCDLRELETILATFAETFPHGYLALAAPDSIYLVGLNEPLALDRAVMQQHLDSVSAASLRDYRWKEPDDFLSMGWLNDDTAARLFEATPKNSFDRPVMDSFAWESFRHSIASKPPQTGTLVRLLGAEPESSMAMVNDGREALKEMIEAESIVLAREKDWLDEATGHYKVALSHLPKLNRLGDVPRQFQILAQTARARTDLPGEFSALMNLIELNAASPEDQLFVGNVLMSYGNTDLALQHIYEATKRSGNLPRYRIALAELYIRIAKNGQAIRYLDLAIADDRIEQGEAVQQKLKGKAKLLKGIAMQKLGQLLSGEALIRDVLESDPELQAVYNRYAVP